MTSPRTGPQATPHDKAGEATQSDAEFLQRVRRSLLGSTTCAVASFVFASSAESALVLGCILIPSWVLGTRLRGKPVVLAWLVMALIFTVSLLFGIPGFQAAVSSADVYHGEILTILACGSGYAFAHRSSFDSPSARAMAVVALLIAIVSLLPLIQTAAAPTTVTVMTEAELGSRDVPGPPASKIVAQAWSASGSEADATSNTGTITIPAAYPNYWSPFRVWVYFNGSGGLCLFSITIASPHDTGFSWERVKDAAVNVLTLGTVRSPGLSLTQHPAATCGGARAGLE